MLINKYKLSTTQVTCKITVTQDNIYIEDSYKVTHIKDMKAFLSKISSTTEITCNVFNTVSCNSLIREWRAHNLLYSLHLFRSHTKDVDLNKNKWYTNILYCVLSCLYPHI